MPFLIITGPKNTLGPELDNTDESPAAFPNSLKDHHINFTQLLFCSKF